MLKRLFHQLSAAVSGAGEELEKELDREAAVRLATAVLLVDVARADYQFDDAEVDLILKLVEKHVALGKAEAEQLAWVAEVRAEELVSLHEFTKLLHRHLTPDEKADVVGLLWQIAYADGRLSKYESSLVLKISDLLHVNRARVMRLKHEAGLQASGDGDR